MKTILFGALILIASVSFGQTITVSNTTGCDINLRFYIDDAPDLNGCQACTVNVCLPDGSINVPVSIAGCGSNVVTTVDVTIRETCSSSSPCITASGLLTSPPGSSCPYPQSLTGISTGSCPCTNSTFNISWNSSTDLTIN
ncbi:MAG: hypothetical protein NWS74_11315 [Salibacteraceae bacterium]|jgi:hypothetical protein|nr:hypothetical protein [Salibacteraceae bacterium]